VRIRVNVAIVNLMIWCSKDFVWKLIKGYLVAIELLWICIKPKKLFVLIDTNEKMLELLLKSSIGKDIWKLKATKEGGRV